MCEKVDRSQDRSRECDIRSLRRPDRLTIGWRVLRHCILCSLVLMPRCVVRERSASMGRLVFQATQAQVDAYCGA